MPIQTAAGWLYPLYVTVVAGGSAGNHTVPGSIDTGDTLVAVHHITADLTSTNTNITSEFTITSANVINNNAGTDTTGAYLLVAYAKKE